MTPCGGLSSKANQPTREQASPERATFRSPCGIPVAFSVSFGHIGYHDQQFATSGRDRRGSARSSATAAAEELARAVHGPRPQRLDQRPRPGHEAPRWNRRARAEPRNVDSGGGCLRLCERTVGARTLRGSCGDDRATADLNKSIGSLLLAPVISLDVWFGDFSSLKHFPCPTRRRIRRRDRYGLGYWHQGSKPALNRR